MAVSSLLRRLTCCDSTQPQSAAGGSQKVLIVGSPNVGKSMLFNRLTGRYVTVSNYPGTTVEVSRGHLRCQGQRYEIIDTPGMYSLWPISDEERVAWRMLMSQQAQAVIHVIDAKNIQRMLGLSLQLIEAGLPVIIALNMADEARRLGIRLDTEELEELLGVPVVLTTATSDEGVEELARRIPTARPSARVVHYGPVLEKAVQAIASRLGDSRLSSRTRAMLCLQGGQDVQEYLARPSGSAGEEIDALVTAAQREMGLSAHYHAALALREEVARLLSAAAHFPDASRGGMREALSRFCMNPITGIPLLAAVLYFGIYQFVGVFGGGTLVDLLEGRIFDERINPHVNAWIDAWIPWLWLQDLFGHEYGVITLGFRYAVGIVLPIVATFFLAFSILEDSGYLPRLAMLIDRVFKRLGLSGRAVIPIVLGFGCDTMATMVTRTLETRRERIIASMLLALAIPCSAQLGVILALLAGHGGAMLAWAGFVSLVFLVAGFLAARLMPGSRPSFYMELPPLRLPKLGNVLVKTYTRLVWYFKEILPLFILASVLIWAGRLSGLFQWTISGLEPVMRSMGLPDAAASAFLFGFFRRDYGAAGLLDLHGRGGLSGNQLVVAAITLTLFLPCIAQLLILKKERGWKAAAGISLGVCAVAYGSGWLVNLILVCLGVRL